MRQKHGVNVGGEKGLERFREYVKRKDVRDTAYKEIV